MRIGDVARLCGVSVGVLRHYEAKRLVSLTRDLDGNRLYTQGDVVRVEIIRSMSLAGISLSAAAIETLQRFL